MTGIYAIIHKDTRRTYIGSALNINNRWKDHLSALRRNDHRNMHLQRCWNKYGEQSFLFVVLDGAVPVGELLRREQDILNAVPGNLRFNICEVAGTMLGYKHRPETCAVLKAIASSPEGLAMRRRVNLGNQNKLGYRTPDETKRKISQARLDRKIRLTQDQRAHLSRIFSIPRIMIDPSGKRISVSSLAVFCREHGLNAGNLSQVALGRRKQHKGWRCEYQ